MAKGVVGLLGQLILNHFVLLVPYRLSFRLFFFFSDVVGAENAHLLLPPFKRLVVTEDTYEHRKIINLIKLIIANINFAALSNEMMEFVRFFFFTETIFQKHRVARCSLYYTRG